VRKLFALVVALTLLVPLVASANADDARVETAKTRNVRVDDNFFKAKTITVRKGTIVKWTWGSAGDPTDVEHDVYSTKGTRLRSGFKTEGTYRKRIRKTTRYLCRVHATTMRGKIVVK
jgi:plastocyanin